MKHGAILLFVILLTACSPTPQETLNSSIDNMLSLVEQGKGQEFMKQYADLSTTDHPYTQLPDESLQKIKSLLLKTKELTPVFSEDKKVATFSHPSLKQPIKFTKHEDRWLLAG